MAPHPRIAHQRIAAAVAGIAATATVVGGCSNDDVLTVTTEESATTASPGWPVEPPTPRRISMLDNAAAELSVEQILTESYGVSDVSAVRCPEAQVAVRGESFECTLVAAGARQKVTVTFTDDGGAYEVSRPVPAGR